MAPCFILPFWLPAEAGSYWLATLEACVGCIPSPSQSSTECSFTVWAHCGAACAGPSIGAIRILQRQAVRGEQLAACYFAFLVTWGSRILLDGHTGSPKFGLCTVLIILYAQ
jgi:hypothetical protein